MSELSKRLTELSPAKRRLLEQRLAAQAEPAEPIALVGMACRFAGAADLAAYWRLIVEGIDATSEIPPDRWTADDYYDANPETPGRMTSRWGGFIAGVDQFDPQFFGIAPREASRMDPQQRLLLEVAWESLEHAGLSAQRMAGTPTGVFVGIGGTDYSKIPLQFENYLEYIDAHVGTGNALSIAANRISYILDLRGPSMAVDTACSSSLLAIHLAVASLRRGECSAALAAGVNLILTPEVMIAFSKARMLSPTGRCRPFDASADGYVRGEGCGALVLKRLSDAQRDGDTIWAVIRGTAANQDGRTSGITAPNSNSQHEVIRAALGNAAIAPAQVSYIEAHGTGTPLGDPIELLGLERLYRRQTPDEPTCYLGSVKANIGHTETASGVASVIRVALMMRHGLIPRQLHFESLNPHVSLAATRLAVPSANLPWTHENGPRIAGVSSYGFGGTNVHVVLEEPPAVTASSSPSSRPWHLLALSAKSKTALGQLARRYVEHIDSHAESAEPLADLCWSANAGRTHFHHRAAVVAQNRTELRERLLAVADGRTTAGLAKGQVPSASRLRVAFLFTGQGSQYVGMGRALFDTAPVFRQAMEQCDAILRPLLERPLLSVLYPAAEQASPIDETAYTQPALFATEYALAALWRSWGIEPDVVLGHSVGEYVAACVAGVFSLEDGLRLIAHRARLMQALPRDGLMAVVFAPAERVERALRDCGDEASIAAVNGPDNTVVSGRAEVVRRLVARFEADGLKTQLLSVSHAFHSPLMEPMLDEFERIAATVDFRPPQIPIVSNLTGELIDSEAPVAGYWRNHVRRAVQFAAGMQKVADGQFDAMVEIGPAPVLLGMGRRCQPGLSAACLPSLRKGRDDWETILESLASLYALGVQPDWAGFDRHEPRRRIELPSYPFERSRFWLESKAPSHAMAAASGPPLHPLLGRRVPTALPSDIFMGRIGTRTLKYLADHQVQGSVVLPGAAYVEMGLAAAEQVFGLGPHVVAGLSIQQPMFLADGDAKLVQVVVSPEVGGSRNYAVYSTTDGADPQQAPWVLHAAGTLQSGQPASVEPRRFDVEAVCGRSVDEKDRQQFYSLMATRGLTYGPTFQGCSRLVRSDRDVVAMLDLCAEIREDARNYRLHPAMLDVAIQSVAGVVPLEPNGDYSPYTYMPVGIGRVAFAGDPADATQAYAVRTSADSSPSPEVVECDVFLLDAEGRVLVEVAGLRAQRVGRGADRDDDAASGWLYRTCWQAAPLVDREDSPVAGRPAAWWLVLADSAVGNLLAEQIRARGDAAVVIASHAVDPLSPATYRCMLDDSLAAHGAGCAGVVHLWSLDVPPLDSAGVAALESSRRLGTASVMALVQQMQRTRFNRPPTLLIATRGAQAVIDAVERVEAAQSPVWGLGRAAAMENAEFRVRLIDLDPADAPCVAAGQLAAETNAPSTEEQVAYRGGQRRVPRLTVAADSLDAAAGHRDLTVPDGPVRLRLGTAGSFDALSFERFVRPSPEPGQVEIAVRAAGLNFSDVLKAMGLYPGLTDAVVPLGIECSGVVTAVGSGVERFQVGDAVMGVAPYSFASHARTAEYALAPKPDGWTDEEAAGVPITFLTAHYALCTLGRLRAGERVLIHAGAGGVGLAAIQIAQHIGAEVFATAGSESKRAFLRSLGVKHVMDSRSTDFAEEIRQLTGREGVDVVLNSLPGEAIPKSLGLLRAYGRFLEIGKIDIYQNRMIGLLPFQDNLSYFAIDLDRMLRQRPAAIRQLFDEVVDRIAAGAYRPLPTTRFGMGDIRDAFRYMAQRKNIGKVVVSMLDRPASTAADNRVGDVVVDDGSYLVTGGLGALGLVVARWLADRGARHLVLLGRQPPKPQAAEQIGALTRQGVRVAVVAGDVADRASLGAALASIPASFPPLRGVVHAAGALADGLLFDMDIDRLDRALSPKVHGAWNLHEATLGLPLDFFVLFSSIAAPLGSPGQANYAAGNAFLDALAAYRVAGGLPALSIDWGPWAEGGMAAEGDRGAQLQARGLRPLPPQGALDVLERLLRTKAVNVAVVDADWAQMHAASSGRGLASLGELWASAAGEQPVRGKQVDRVFLDRLAGLEPTGKAAALAEYFSLELARIMGIDAADLELGRPLNAMGLDSLMAMELKNNLETRLGFSLPMATFFDGPSVNSLALVAAKLLTGEQSESSEGDSSSAWSPLVKLAEGAGRPPLFCIHPLGGDVRCYVELARQLGDSWPVYALRGRGAGEGQSPHATMEELAADYASAIQRVQPEGPYYLAGWSAGGLYALEVARALRSRDERIGLLALFDTPLPSIFDSIDLDDYAHFIHDLVNFTNRFAGAAMDVSYETLRRLNDDAAFQMALDEAKRHGVVPADAKPELIRRLCEMGRANVRLIMRRCLPPIDYSIAMFHPETKGMLAEVSRQSLPDDLGWSGVKGLALSTFETPGDHFSMLTGNGAVELGQRLRKRLEAARATRASDGQAQ